MFGQKAMLFYTFHYVSFLHQLPFNGKKLLLKREILRSHIGQKRFIVSSENKFSILSLLNTRFTETLEC